MSQAGLTILTVGHGNRPWQAFLDLLREAEVGCLVDVRARPASRRHPWFARAEIERALSGAGVQYRWEGRALGGFRKHAASRHPGLDEPGFRAFACHMESDEFREAVERLLGLAQAKRCVLMCAEKDPSRCHRALIADYLTVLGTRVVHLIDHGRRLPHRLHPAARVAHGVLVYDRMIQHSMDLP